MFDDKRLHALNEAWGRGYLHAIHHPRANPPWPPGATGSEWARGGAYANAEIGWLGATEIRETTTEGTCH
jgi:hypothetical protein